MLLFGWDCSVISYKLLLFCSGVELNCALNIHLDVEISTDHVADSTLLQGKEISNGNVTSTSSTVKRGHVSFAKDAHIRDTTNTDTKIIPENKSLSYNKNGWKATQDNNNCAKLENEFCKDDGTLMFTDKRKRRRHYSDPIATRKISIDV